MSLLEDVQYLNKYDREGACVKKKNEYSINCKIKPYNKVGKGDDPSYLIY